MDARFYVAVGLTIAVAVVYVAASRLVDRLVGWRAPDAEAKDAGARRFFDVGRSFGLLYVAAAIVAQVVDGEGALKVEAAWGAAYAALGFALYALAGQLGVRLLLGAKLRAEIDSGNVAAGIAAGAHHTAMGFLVAEAAIGDDARGLALSIGFFTIGVVVHQGIVALFRFTTAYDDAEQIAGENEAAAIRFAGVSLAVALIVARALDGDFEGWTTSLLGFAQTAALALVLLPIRPLVVDGLLLRRRPKLRGGALDEAVGTRRDAAHATLDAAVMLAAAIAVVRLL